MLDIIEGFLFPHYGIGTIEEVECDRLHGTLETFQLRYEEWYD